MRSEPGATRLNIVLRRDAMAHQLVALLGMTPKTALEFAPSLDLRDGHARSLARFARLAITELERPDSILLEPMTARSFREFFATALLLHQPHNYSDRLKRLELRVMPRDVKRAIDYMDANLDAAIGLAEIVAAVGVPGRTLIQHFREFKGTSPLRYLRDTRYQRLREALSRAEPEQTVTELALNWGFTHMGRFSVEYRKRFGESPSQTLRRRKVVVAVGDCPPTKPPARADRSQYPG
jgi:AraC-like DNA-binding protein